MVPSLRKAGLSLASDSTVVSGRLCSSLAKLSGPLRPCTSTGDDLGVELACGLRGSEALLRALAPSGPDRRGVMLILLDEILGVPAGVLAGEGVVQPVASACCRRSVASPMPIAPAPAGHQVGRHGPCSPCRRRWRSRSKPSQISCAAVAMACAPEPQTRFTVMRGHLDGQPRRRSPPAAPGSSCCRPG